MDALSQNAASLSFANTTSAHAAAYRSDSPSPTNTVTASAAFSRSIAAGLQVAQPCAHGSGGCAKVAAPPRAHSGRRLLDTICEPARRAEKIQLPVVQGFARMQ